MNSHSGNKASSSSAAVRTTHPYERGRQKFAEPTKLIESRGSAPIRWVARVDAVILSVKGTAVPL